MQSFEERVSLIDRARAKSNSEALSSLRYRNLQRMATLIAVVTSKMTLRDRVDFGVMKIYNAGMEMTEEMEKILNEKHRKSNI